MCIFLPAQSIYDSFLIFSCLLEVKCSSCHPQGRAAPPINSSQLLFLVWNFLAVFLVFPCFFRFFVFFFGLSIPLQFVAFIGRLFDGPFACSLFGIMHKFHFLSIVYRPPPPRAYCSLFVHFVFPFVIYLRVCECASMLLIFVGVIALPRHSRSFVYEIKITPMRCPEKNKKKKKKRRMRLPRDFGYFLNKFPANKKWPTRGQWNSSWSKGRRK